MFKIAWVFYLWAMKFFSLILGLFILLLSVLPCCQEEDCCEDEGADRQEATSHGADADSELPCSPFFSCGTCLGFTQERLPELTLDIPFSPIADEVVGFTVSQSNGYFFSLIKPPTVYFVG